VVAACLALPVLSSCASVPPRVLLPPAPLTPATLPAALEAYTGAPVVGGNSVEVLLNGEQIFPAILEAIRSARQTITLAQYFYGGGDIGRQVAEALGERCRAGVGVKMLLDAFGSRGMPREHVTRLRRDGCHVRFFRPLYRLDATGSRNHRRILVVDGRLGFTGGAGVARRWMGNGRKEDHWRDTDVRVEGPVVEHLQEAFAENWLEATGLLLEGPAYFPRPYEPRGAVRGQVIRSSPLAGRYAIYAMFQLAVAAARRSILITTPYFLPDAPIVEALTRAAGRGVRVAVLAPGPIDYNLVRRASHGNFERLLEHGVEIYEYDPALLHAKTLVIDGVWATVGSANLDNRSFAINAELNLVVHDAGFAGRLEQIFADDLAYSTRVDLERWRSRGLGSRLLELLAVPFRPLL